MRKSASIRKGMSVKKSKKVILLLTCILLTACSQSEGVINSSSQAEITSSISETKSSILEDSINNSSSEALYPSKNFTRKTLEEIETRNPYLIDEMVVPIKSEKHDDAEDKVIIRMVDIDGNPVKGLNLSFRGYTGYSFEDNGDGTFSGGFPEIGFKALYAQGKEKYGLTDENGEFVWKGSQYNADPQLMRHCWLDVEAELKQGEDPLYKNFAFYDLDATESGTHYYEYLWWYPAKD